MKNIGCFILVGSFLHFFKKNQTPFSLTTKVFAKECQSESPAFVKKDQPSKRVPKNNVILPCGSHLRSFYRGGPKLADLVDA